MKLLVLDLATATGFCFGTEAGPVEHGSFKLPSTGGDIGSFLNHYRTWLSAAISRWNPDEIVFEMPIMPDTTSLPIIRKLYSLCGLTELIAGDRHVRCGEANLLDIRRHFIGSHRAPKEVTCEPGCKRKGCGRCRLARRTWIKESTITMCRKRGFRPADDNDADALALFSYVQSTLTASWNAGHNAREIATALSQESGKPVTRNMVVSKVHRLGLKMHQPNNSWRNGSKTGRRSA